MFQTESNRQAEKGAADLERYIIRAIEAAETTFERLAFIGSLRNAYTGHYLHEGWTGIATVEEVHAMAAEFHSAIFRLVLRLPITELTKELRHHFELLQRCPQRTSALWLETEPFRDLIPRGCSCALREFFISNMRIALEVLYRVPDWPEIVGRSAATQPQLNRRLTSERWLN